MAILPKIRYLRRRLFSRARHARKLDLFLTAEATALGSTSSSTTVTPAAVAAAKAACILTVGATPGNGKVVVIDNKTYTFKTTLTEVKATSTFTNDGSAPADGSTVVIHGKTYTFQSTLTDVDGHVHISTNTASMTNLFHAINGTGGTIGTDYATSTVANADVVATNPSGTTVVITAKVPGIAANSFATTQAGTSHGTWTSTAMAGGVDPILNEIHIGGSATNGIANLTAAIGHSGTEGTDWATGTVVHATVEVSAHDATTMSARAKTAGVVGNYIPVSTDLATSSWADTHLTAGVEASVGPTFAATTHGRSTGAGPIRIVSSNGVAHVPAGFDAAGDYWIIANTADVLSLAVSREEAFRGNAVGFTDVGTGTITIKRAADAEGIYDTMRQHRPEAIVAATDIDQLN